MSDSMRPRAEDEPRRDDAQRTVESIAMMLGWMNVPPRETLEADIRALKARAQLASPSPSALALAEQLEQVAKRLRAGNFSWKTADANRLEQAAEFLRTASQEKKSEET